MSFIDKLFRWKKKPFKSAHPPLREGGDQSGKEKIDKIESHGTGKYAHVLLRPHTSEKAVSLGVLNQYVFEVAPQTTKQEITFAIFDLYGVTPEAVNLINISGKQIRFGRSQGKTKAWKKAIVTLPEGKTIDVYKK